MNRNWLRSLHVGNVANVAYGYAKILSKYGASVKLICHDVTHLMSQPEWDDLLLDPDDFPDENRFDLNTADFGGYQRPGWFLSETLRARPPGFSSAVFALFAALADSIQTRAGAAYYRIRRVKDLLSAKTSGSTEYAGHVKELARAALKLGPQWRVDSSALASYSRYGDWVSAHAK